MWRQACKLLFCMGMVQSVLKVLLRIAGRDKETPGYSLQMTHRLRLLSLLSGEVVYMCGTQWAENVSVPRCQSEELSEIMVYVTLAIMAGCLLMACITDCQNCMVYQYVWWIGGMAGMFLLLRSCQKPSCFYEDGMGKYVLGTLINLIPIFVIGFLQEKLFCKMYGRADCHAFLVCGFAECAMGFGVKEHLLHMILAVFLLAIIQGMKKNIGRNGNLKKKVPFLPYITVSFWVVLIGSWKLS